MPRCSAYQARRPALVRRLEHPADSRDSLHGRQAMPIRSWVERRRRRGVTGSPPTSRTRPRLPPPAPRPLPREPVRRAARRPRPAPAPPRPRRDPARAPRGRPRRARARRPRRAQAEARGPRRGIAPRSRAAPPRPTRRAGSAGGSGSPPGSASGRAPRRRGSAARVRSLSGTTESSARVYGCRGSSSSSSVVPCSTMRPRYITATRSAMFHASPRSCVTTRIATPVSRTSPSMSCEDLAAHRGVEARDRLVGDEQLRLEHHRARDHHALTLPARDLVRVQRAKNRSGGRSPAARARRRRAAPRRPSTFWMRSPSATAS